MTADGNIVAKLERGFMEHLADQVITLLVDTYAINVPSRVTKIDSVLHLWLKWQSITKQI